VCFRRASVISDAGTKTASVMVGQASDFKRITIKRHINLIFKIDSRLRFGAVRMISCKIDVDLFHGVKKM